MEQTVMQLVKIILVLTLATLTEYSAAFNYEDVVTIAKQTAAKPYQERELIPSFLRDLSFQEYQNIRFNPDKSLWRDSGSNFQVMLFSPGLYYSQAVDLQIVDAQGMHPLAYDRGLFNFTDPELEKRIPPNLGYAGFQLTFPLHNEKVQSQFLVFAGASYFRGVGKNNAWGLSGRGVAVDTGLPSGEDFPSFTRFWLVRPAAKAKSMTLYGLLDGKSVVGAYQFVVTPGEHMTMVVNATLIPRKDINLLGVAPLTSMFFYGENTARPRGEWRTEVHDSDGLLIHDGSSKEWLWRPLIDPLNLQIDYFKTHNVRGFGLFQRDRNFPSYQDLEAHYQQRPSMWVTPQGEWGNGHVVLVQLPTTTETNDNIVAFWTPAEPVKQHVPIRLNYNVSVGDAMPTAQPVAHVLNTFVGDGNIIGGGNTPGAYRVVVDFAGVQLDKLARDAAVIGEVTGLEGTAIIEQYVQYNSELKAWRLSILARPAEDSPLSLRGFLKLGDQALSETWTYKLPFVNDINGNNR
jgi:glucans biosynthesis protein